MLDDWKGFGAKLLKTIMKDLEGLIILAFAAILKYLGGFEAFFDGGFAKLEDDNGLDFVAGAGGN